MRLAVSIEALVVEGCRGTQAMGRSWELVGGHWWHAFGTLLVAGLLAGVMNAVITAPFGNTAWLVQAVAAAVATVVTLPYGVLVGVLLYLDLRARKENLTLERLRADLQASAAYDIAEQLTAEGVPSPAGHDRARNPHRHGRAWGKSAVRAILRNPRYTGYQVWGRQRRDEVLLDVDDVAAGHTSRRHWNPADQWIWSVEPAHQALVSRQTFEAVQARRNHRTSGTPRKGRSDTRVYLLRGRLRCGLCQRRLQGQWVHRQAYYRCRYPAEYATAAGFDHPKSVYLREADLLSAIDAWLAQLTDPDHLQATCEAIAATSHASAALDQERATARQVVADCDRRLGRYRAALEAGTDPGVVGQWIVEVTATRQAAQAILHDQAAPPPLVGPEQVRRAIQEVGGLLVALDGSDPALRAQLYQELGIEGTYDPHRRVVVVQADLGRPIERVGGGT